MLRQTYWPSCRQFELQHAGQDSPGPACYDSVAAALAGSVLGDRRTAHFGTGSRGTAAAAIVVVAPGPGAYKCDEVCLHTMLLTSPAVVLSTVSYLCDVQLFSQVVAHCR